MTDEELQYLVSHYKPDIKILEALAGVRLLAVVGPAAAGKTTIMEMAVQKSPLLHMVSSVTSRARREDEKEAVEFSFFSKEQMIEGMKKGAYVQVAMYRTGDLYGTRLQDYFLGKIGLKAVSSIEIPNFRKLFPELKVAFIVPGSYEAWMQRFNKRQSSEEDNAKRLSEAKISLEFGLSDKNTHLILNDTLDQAVDRLIQVAEGQKPEGEDQARQLASQYLAKLGSNT